MLTEAQRELLSEVARGETACTRTYKPAIRLVEKGLCVWRVGKLGQSELEITPAGRAALEGE